MDTLYAFITNKRLFFKIVVALQPEHICILVYRRVPIRVILTNRILMALDYVLEAENLDVLQIDR